MSYSNQKSDSSRTILDERAILGLGIVFILIPLLLEAIGFRFTDRFMNTKDLLNQSPIGEVLRQRKTVRKRAEDSSVFAPLVPGDSIFVGDRVLTGKESSARITLSDGNILELGPESLIRIEPIRAVGIGGIKRKLKITLESGTVKAAVRSQSSPVVVENTKGEVILEATPPPPLPPPPPVQASSGIEAASDKPQSTIVSEPEFSSAELSLTGLNAEPAPAPVRELIQQEDFRAKNESNRKNPSAEKEKSEDRPLLSKINLIVRPPAEEIVFLPFPRDITLSDRIPIRHQHLKVEWKPIGYGIGGSYLVSLKENGIERTVETKNSFVELPVPDASHGRLEFKVTAPMKDGDSIQSKQNSLQWKLPSPTLVTPAHNEKVLESSLIGKSKKLLLSWKEMPACIRFRVEVTGKAGGSTTPNLVHETVENFIPVPLVGSNLWTWRVWCYFSDQTGIPSSSSDFTLETDPQP